MGFMTPNWLKCLKTLLKRSVYFLFTVGITLWIFNYLFSVISFEDVIDAIKKSSLYYLGLFFLFSMVMSIGRTWRYMLFLNISGHQPSRMALFLVTLARNFFSDLLPARIGTLVYIYLAQTRLGIPFDAAASSFALSFIFDIIVLVLMMIGTSMFISSALLAPGIMMTVSLMALLICLAILHWLPNGLQRMGLVLGNWSIFPYKIGQKIKESLTSTSREIQQIKSQKIYTRVMALSVVVRLGKYLSLYALLLAIVVPLGFMTTDFPFYKIFWGLCGAEFSASLPISGFAGFGAYEGTWALIFQLLGYEANLAALTSVTHHLISQIYGYVLGVAALLILLVPFFKESSLKPKVHFSNKGVIFFWFPYGMLVVAIGALFLITVSKPYSGNATSNLAVELKKAPSKIPLHQGTLPNGRVVFMKTDGLYVQELGSDTEKHVLAKGTYPRWSPDGKKIAFLNGHQIGIFNLTTGTTQYIAKVKDPRAVAFHDTGKSILYTNGLSIFSIDIHSQQKKKVTQGRAYLELDVAQQGSLLAVSAKDNFWYSVYVIDINSNREKKIARGCSASLSPDGGKVMVNGPSHLELKLFDRISGQKVATINAPSGLKFDNQFWSNHPDWIASMSEGDEGNIYVHRVSTNQSWQVTRKGDCNRPDLYVVGGE